MQQLRRFLKRLLFRWQHDVDAIESYVFVTVCIIVVSFVWIAALLFMKDEFTAASIFVLTAALFIKDVLCSNISEMRKERKELEKDVDRRFRILYSERYEASTCRDCIFRFTCNRAYNKEETNGRCSLEMYKK